MNGLSEILYMVNYCLSGDNIILHRKSHQVNQVKETANVNVAFLKSISIFTLAAYFPLTKYMTISDKIASYTNE